MAITQERLKELLSYDPLTGVFLWMVKRCNKRPGDVAGCNKNRNYTVVYVEGRFYRAHRLAWFYMTGGWAEEIDHKNGIKTDNSFSNLRDVTHSVNGQNQRKARSDNKLGFLGVSKRRGGFRSVIKANGKYLHLGDFKTPELAYSAYLEAKRKLHPGCTI